MYLGRGRGRVGVGVGVRVRGRDAAADVPLRRVDEGGDVLADVLGDA